MPSSSSEDQSERLIRAMVGLMEVVSSSSTRYNRRWRPGTKASFDFEGGSTDFFSVNIRALGSDEQTSVPIDRKKLLKDVEPSDGCSGSTIGGASRYSGITVTRVAVLITEKAIASLGSICTARGDIQIRHFKRME